MRTAAAQARVDRRWSENFPTVYLNEYYRSFGTDERESLNFLVDLLPQLGLHSARALEFGCGPTVHRALAIEPYVRDVTFADLLSENLAAVRAWQNREAPAFEWTSYTEFILKAEGKAAPPEAVVEREAALRAKMSGLIAADARNSDPLGSANRGAFELVIAGYCLEAVGPHRRDFAKALSHVLSLVAPKGVAIVMTLASCSRYRLDGQMIDCYPVSAQDLGSGYASAGFETHRVETRPVVAHGAQGYTAVHLSWGRRAAGGTARRFRAGVISARPPAT